MLTSEQVNLLVKNSQFIETGSIKYNLKYAWSFLSVPELSTFDMGSENKMCCVLIFIYKLFLKLFGVFFISYELGTFRNAIIERILNSSCKNDFDICTFIRPNMKWIEAKSSKIEYIRKNTIEILTIIDIQLLIYNIVGKNDENERKIFFNQLIEKVNCIFGNKIAELLKNVSIESENEYNIFVKKYSPYLKEHLRKQHFNGNLFNII